MFSLGDSLKCAVHIIIDKDGKLINTSHQHLHCQITFSSLSDCLHRNTYNTVADHDQLKVQLSNRNCRTTLYTAVSCRGGEATNNLSSATVLEIATDFLVTTDMPWG